MRSKVISNKRNIFGIIKETVFGSMVDFFKELGGTETDEMQEEAAHADSIIRRVLFLEGKPNMNRDDIVTGEDVVSCLKADLDRPHDQVVARVVRWLKRRCPDNGVLNVAGSRRSKASGIHRAVKKVMLDVLGLTCGSPNGPRRRGG